MGNSREFSQHHSNLKPKRFEFCIKYKKSDRTCHLELFGHLEDIDIASSVALLRSFSIPKGKCLPNLKCFRCFKGLFLQTLIYDFVTAFFQSVPANTRLPSYRCSR